jgi:Tat protein translocase TatC
MSFGDHLDELRRRLLLAVAAPLPLFIVIFFFSDTLVEWLLLPVYDVLRHHDIASNLQVLSPPEFLLTKVKLSVIAALVVTAPWLLWQVWQFVAPGLYGHERRFVYFLIPGSAILTVCGIALLYFVMLPLMLHVLVMFGADIDIKTGAPEIDPQVQRYVETPAPVPEFLVPPAAPEVGTVWKDAWTGDVFVALPDEDGVVAPRRVPPPNPRGRIDQTFRVSFVVNFTLVLMLGITIAFQMPLVILLLGWLGLASVPWLRAKRRYALAICGVVAAVITPADAVSMILMLVPLYALYELGILLLVVAPASAIAEGTFVSRLVRWRNARGGSDKSRRGQSAQSAPPDRAAQTAKPAQAEGTEPRSPRTDQSASGNAEGGDGA